MSHKGLLNPVMTLTPVRTQWSTVTSITVACTMYSIPFDPDATSYYIDASDQQQTSTGSSDESQKVTLGSDSFTWSVPTAHQSTADPYKIDWLYFSDKENNEKQMPLIRASEDYKTMMSGLVALQLTHE